MVPVTVRTPLRAVSPDAGPAHSCTAGPRQLPAIKETRMAPHFPSWRDQPVPYVLTAEGQEAAHEADAEAEAEAEP